MKCRVKQTRKIAYFLKNLVFYTQNIENRVTFDRSKNESVLLCTLLVVGGQNDDDNILDSLIIVTVLKSSNHTYFFHILGANTRFLDKLRDN